MPDAIKSLTVYLKYEINDIVIFINPEEKVTVGQISGFAGCDCSCVAKYFIDVIIPSDHGNRKKYIALSDMIMPFFDLPENFPNWAELRKDYLELTK